MEIKHGEVQEEDTLKLGGILQDIWCTAASEFGCVVLDPEDCKKLLAFIAGPR